MTCIYEKTRVELEISGNIFSSASCMSQTLRDLELICYIEEDDQ